MLILCPSHAAETAADATFDWVRSGSGQVADESGQSALALLPQDQDVVLVVPPHALSWHRVALPKVPAKRLRVALDGMLEERLLGEVGDLHFALAAGARPAQEIWVCACERQWLRGLLDQLEAAKRPASRIVPAAWPGVDDSVAVHHAFTTGERTWLSSCTADGVCLLPLDPGTGPATLQACAGRLGDEAAEPRTEQWLADPAVLAQAEERLQQRFTPLPMAEHLLRCAASPWNLAQFDLSLSAGARLGQRARQQWRDFMNAPQWRPARWGLVALLLAGVGGLNTSAWMAKQQADSRASAIERLLRESFPQVSVVLDAPTQMQQELRRLRAASGSLGSQDLEILLAALGRHLPPGTPVPARLQYDGRSLTLGSWDVTGEQMEAIRQSLRTQGWTARIDGAQLQLEPGQE